MLYVKAELDNLLSLVFIVVAVVVFGPTSGQGAATCPSSLNCRTCDTTFTYCTTCNSGYTLYNGTCQPCGTNCLQCDYGSCTLCMDGNGPSPNDSRNCAPCTPAFCSYCPSDINTCLACNAGYGQISGSQNCGPCSPNCAVGCNTQGAGKCDRCDAGYGYTATNSCATCSAGCNNTVGCYNSGAGLCDQCASGFGVVSSTSKSCGACSPNCAAGCANSGAGKCDRCDPGFGYTATNSCAPCSSNCAAGCYVLGASKCDHCDLGYGFTATNSCAPCSQYCFYGCNNTGAGGCDTCDYGTGKLPSSTACSPCSSNCSAGCSNAGAGKCDHCDQGYGFTATNSCAPCSPNCAAGCANSGAGECDKCDQGFSFTATNSCAPGPDFCSSSPCQNGGTCQNQNNTYSCTCAPGFTNYSCEIEIDECETLPCYPFGWCVDEINNYTCNCLPGFYYVNDQYCQEIDECNAFSQTHPNETICLNNGSCVNIGLTNNFYCKCQQNKEGFIIYGQRCELDTSRNFLPQFLGISKSFGLQSGGSAITFTGVGLTNIPPIGVYFNAIAYGLETLFGYVLNETLQPRSFVVLTPKSYGSYIGHPLSLSVLLSGGSLVPLPSNLNFTYVGNPTITDIQPRTQIAYGGIILTVIGYNFDAVVTPQMTVTLKLTYINATNNVTWYKQYPKRICSDVNQFSLTCLLPVFDVFLSPSSSMSTRKKRETTSSHWSLRERLTRGLHWMASIFGRHDPQSLYFLPNHRRRRDKAPAKFTVGDFNAEMFLNFTLDNYPRYENISKPLPNVTFNIVDSRPEINSTGNQDIDPSTDPVNIKGQALLYGVSPSDYSVAIGNGSCNITDVTDDEVTCTAPMVEPQLNNDSIWHCSNFPEHLAVMVTAASSEYFAFCLKYKPKNQTNIYIIIGICVGVGGLLLIILAVVVSIIIHRRRHIQPLSNRHNRLNNSSFSFNGQGRDPIWNYDTSLPIEDSGNHGVVTSELYRRRIESNDRHTIFPEETGLGHSWMRLTEVQGRGSNY